MNKKNCFVFKPFCVINYLKKKNKTKSHPNRTMLNSERSLDEYIKYQRSMKVSTKESKDFAD